METPDDEVARLISRILELRSKVNSQAERLNKALAQDEPSQDGETSGQMEPEEPEWRVERREPQDLRHAFKAFIATPPLPEPREEWIPEVFREDEFLHGELSRCRECRYKEGLEEVLNILAVCGLIRKSPSRRDGSDEPDPLRAYCRQAKRRVTSAFYY